MLNFTATWKQLLTDLERERDELRLKAHLGKAEARDLLKKADKKLEELREKLEASKASAKAKAKSAKATTSAKASDASTKAKAIAKEIKDSFARIRRII